MNSPIDLLVLDVHGVILNNPFMTFLDELAEITGQSADVVRSLWRHEVHDPAWTGGISDEVIWARLASGQADHIDLADRLEEHYESGPAAPHLERWRERLPIWVLSNHRAHWLLPRLERFGLLDFFDRLLVSDRIGAMKPDCRAFADVVSAVGNPGSVLFVDDRKRNVRAARSVGLRALHANATIDWIAHVDRAIADANAPCTVTELRPSAMR